MVLDVYVPKHFPFHDRIGAPQQLCLNKKKPQGSALSFARSDAGKTTEELHDLNSGVPPRNPRALRNTTQPHSPVLFDKYLPSNSVHPALERSFL